MIKYAISLVVFIRLMGFQEMIYRINVDNIAFYTDVYPPEPSYQCEITLVNKEKLSVKHTCDEVDLNIANSLKVL